MATFFRGHSNEDLDIFLPVIRALFLMNNQFYSRQQDLFHHYLPLWKSFHEYAKFDSKRIFSPMPPLLKVKEQKSTNDSNNHEWFYQLALISVRPLLCFPIPFSISILPSDICAFTVLSQLHSEY